MGILNIALPEHNHLEIGKHHVNNVTFILSKNTHSYTFYCVPQFLNMSNVSRRYSYSSYV